MEAMNEAALDVLRKCILLVRYDRQAHGAETRDVTLHLRKREEDPEQDWSTAKAGSVLEHKRISHHVAGHLL